MLEDIDNELLKWLGNEDKTVYLKDIIQLIILKEGLEDNEVERRKIKEIVQEKFLKLCISGHCFLSQSGKRAYVPITDLKLENFVLTCFKEKYLSTKLKDDCFDGKIDEVKMDYVSLLSCKLLDQRYCFVPNLKFQNTLDNLTTKNVLCKKKDDYYLIKE